MITCTRKLPRVHVINNLQATTMAAVPASEELLAQISANVNLHPKKRVTYGRARAASPAAFEQPPAAPSRSRSASSSPPPIRIKPSLADALARIDAEFDEQEDAPVPATTKPHLSALPLAASSSLTALSANNSSSTADSSEVDHIFDNDTSAGNLTLLTSPEAGPVTRKAPIDRSSSPSAQPTKPFKKCKRVVQASSDDDEADNEADSRPANGIKVRRIIQEESVPTMAPMFDKLVAKPGKEIWEREYEEAEVAADYDVIDGHRKPSKPSKKPRVSFVCCVSAA